MARFPTRSGLSLGWVTAATDAMREYLPGPRSRDEQAYVLLSALDALAPGKKAAAKVSKMDFEDYADCYNAAMAACVEVSGSHSWRKKVGSP